MGLGSEQFVNAEAISDTLRCSICTDIFDAPVFSSNGQCQHTFCRLCVDMCLQRAPRCPVCREPLQHESMRPHQALQSLVDELPVRCEQSCGWTGRLDMRPGHKDACPVHRLAEAESELAAVLEQLRERDQELAECKEQLLERSMQLEQASRVNAAMSLSVGTRSGPSERVEAQDAQRSLDTFQFISGSRPPSYWACRGRYEWHRSHYMEQVVKDLLVHTTCPDCLPWRLSTDVNIVKVDRVENLIHWNSYAGRRAEIVEQSGTLRRHVARSIQLSDARLDDVANEVFLWYGLPAANVPVIANAGLDERVASCNGLYGSGIYLTDQWCKALQYSRAGNCSIRHKRCGQLYRCSCRGPKKVLLCRALLGEPYYVRPGDNLKGQRRPPARESAEPGILYDSIIAEPGMFMMAHNRNQIHGEYVLFDRKSVYPEFVIELEWDCS